MNCNFKSNSNKLYFCYIQREFRVHLQQNIPIAFLKVLHPDVPCKYHGKCHITLKGTSDAKFTLTWCFHICFSRVWTQLTYNDTNLFTSFFKSPKNIKSQFSRHLDFLSRMTSYCSGPAHDCWWTVPYLDISVLSQLYAVCHFLRAFKWQQCLESNAGVL